eukprot:Pompholyxophrys_sp_v1_NODE_458_length_544_cov_9.997955.p1 type:complete len:115 gc:universal NODE_458_length_544_cov_9.997955:434-90(-)
MRMCMQPPNEITNIPRSIEEMGKYWKSVEHQHYLTLYSPIMLCNIMQPVQFQHWLKFVEGLNILLSKRTIAAMFRRAKILLTDFCREFKEIYGQLHENMNIHLIRHIHEHINIT